ncbi:hypothetical protein LEP1GSC024_3364 [Leptospira noguchii str. 2001034031]|uniref:Uncharacterized protein n=1 Tax=Leptospira noguchii str. 2001034031 TaxID=1193053 RepID=M6XZU4_9LEPT|nr:hypothetical protein LEP1GSC024_3364 [Leptospira noguchii str. 2001034031]
MPLSMGLGFGTNSKVELKISCLILKKQHYLFDLIELLKNESPLSFCFMETID